MAISTDTILYEKRDSVGYITLNRPEALNALNKELSSGLREALAEIRDDPEVILGIIIGAGWRAFSAGMDLKERATLDSQGNRPFLDPRGAGSFVDMGVYKPLIAAIDGFCVAGG